VFVRRGEYDPASLGRCRLPSIARALYYVFILLFWHHRSATAAMGAAAVLYTWSLRESVVIAQKHQHDGQDRADICY
jgi:hypothetical protein